MRSVTIVHGVVVVLCSLPGPRLWSNDRANDPESPRWLLPVPELDADATVPELAKVVGHTWGQDVSSHAQVETYLRALTDAAPRNTRWTKYGETYEGRGLYYLAISSSGNIDRLDEIRRDNLLLADPRSLPESRARELIGKVPAIVWLSYTVHGNESSGSDAALLTAYHLLIICWPIVARRRERSSRRSSSSSTRSRIRTGGTGSSTPTARPAACFLRPRASRPNTSRGGPEDASITISSISS
jgi:hypothetical protein